LGEGIFIQHFEGRVGCILRGGGDPSLFGFGLRVGILLITAGHHLEEEFGGCGGYGGAHL